MENIGNHISFGTLRNPSIAATTSPPTLSYISQPNPFRILRAVDSACTISLLSRVASQMEYARHGLAISLRRCFLPCRLLGTHVSGFHHLERRRDMHARCTYAFRSYSSLSHHFSFSNYHLPAILAPVYLSSQLSPFRPSL